MLLWSSRALLSGLGMKKAAWGLRSLSLLRGLGVAGLTRSRSLTLLHLLSRFSLKRLKPRFSFKWVSKYSRLLLPLFLSCLLSLLPSKRRPAARVIASS